jgi:predicted DNA binding CopG/RHH family protein
MKKKPISRQSIKKLAKSIQASRGNLSEWSEQPIPAKTSKTKPGVMFSIRFSRHELDAIKQRAQAEGVPISVLIKRSVLEPQTSTTPQIVWNGLNNSGYYLYAFDTSCNLKLHGDIDLSGGTTVHMNLDNYLKAETGRFPPRQEEVA